MYVNLFATKIHKKINASRIHKPHTAAVYMVVYTYKKVSTFTIYTKQY